MQRRTLLVAGVLILGLVPGMLLIGWESEPRYGGKRVSQWAIELSYGSAEQIEDARIAIRALGPRAVPPLIRMLQRTDSKLGLLLRKMPFVWWLDSPANTYHALAVSALRELGPLAEPAIPALEKVAQGTDTLVRSKATAALLVIRHQPTEPLAQVLQDRTPAHLSNWVVAAQLASELGDHARPLIPLFLESLKDTNARVRLRATWALGTIALEPEVCVPALLTGLKDTDPIVRQGSLSALRRFPGAVARAQAEVQQCLADADLGMRLTALFLLTESASSLNSNSVAQVVQPLLNDPEEGVRNMAKDLLNELRKRH